MILAILQKLLVKKSYYKSRSSGGLNFRFKHLKTSSSLGVFNLTPSLTFLLPFIIKKSVFLEDIFHKTVLFSSILVVLFCT